MKEELLHYAWRVNRIDLTKLSTTKGDQIEILSKGNYNTNAGPDFLEGKVRIKDTIWVGHIEMHIKSSDWIKHNHQSDPAYDSVILHVVYNHDLEIYRKDGSIIPVLDLSHLIDEELILKYEDLVANEKWIPCETEFFQVSEFVKETWKDRLIIDRLEDKTILILEDLEKSQMNWEQTFFTYLSMHLGTKVNKEGFRLLCRSISLNTLQKHRGQVKEIESLLFGQAGFLNNEFEEAYPKELSEIYRFLKKKYNLQNIESSVWNFLRLRPPNFPTLRIAQLAQILDRTEHLFSKCMAANNVKEIENAFEIKLGQYWRNHYVLDKLASKPGNKKLGKATIHNIIINTIVPFLFIYSIEKGIEKYKDKALRLLEEISPENNKIIRKWNELGYRTDHALDTQALIQLKNKYCSLKKCVQCQIGHSILK